MNETTLIVGLQGSGKSTIANYASTKYPKVTVITNFADDFRECVPISDIRQICEFHRVCFVNDNFEENEIAMLLTYKLGNRLLIVDEAHLFQESEHLNRILRFSRHTNLDLILLSQSLFDAERTNRHLIQNLIVMRMTDDKGRGDNYEINRIQAIDDSVEVRKIQQYEFAIVKGKLPKFFDEKDLTMNKYFYKLKIGSF